MARTWQALFVTGEDAPAPEPPEEEAEAGGFFRRLRENLSQTRRALGSELQTTMTGTLDDDAWERLEETLIYADVGPAATARIVERLEAEGGENLAPRLRELLAESARVGDDRIDLRHDPTVILVVGVNGTGKTTTIGKLAWHLTNELGRSVLLAAADTFRA